jgi:NitT/TauT family transport system permease protein
VASDLNLPHLWTIAESYAQPSRRNGPPLIDTLVSAALFTFREAVTGSLFGSFLGLLLGIIFAHSNLLERGLMPYVVASQTVPILAIAPMVIIWLKAGWVSVAVISAYLTFFPVTINTLRGLRSPDPVAVELMRSYAASNWQTLWKLRFPAALPYIFTALKVSATASVVGAIIGELPSGIRDGLGGAILNFNQYYITGPEKLWASILITAVVGIAFYLIIIALERLTLAHHHRPLDL